MFCMPFYLLAGHALCAYCCMTSCFIVHPPRTCTPTCFLRRPAVRVLPCADASLLVPSCSYPHSGSCLDGSLEASACGARDAANRNPALSQPLSLSLFHSLCCGVATAPLPALCEAHSLVAYGLHLCAAACGTPSVLTHALSQSSISRSLFRVRLRCGFLCTVGWLAGGI